MAKLIKADSTTSPAVSEVALNLADFADQARQIVLDARKDAARIVAQARTHAETLTKMAQQKGYEEGFDEGKKNALALAAKDQPACPAQPATDELAKALMLVEDLAKQLQQAKNEIMQNCSNELLELALEIARRIVVHVAPRDIDVAKANLAKVLELSAASKDMTVRVNPEQLSRLQLHTGELVGNLGIRGHLRLVADENIPPGGVKLQTRCGELDATVIRQLENVMEALLGPKDDLPLLGTFWAHARNETTVIPSDFTPSSMQVPSQ